MKFLHLSFALFLAILIHQQSSNIYVEAGDGFIRTRGAHFLLNGNLYYANGFNAYWLMYVASDPSQKSKVSTAFHEAASHGLTVARTWAFSDGGYRPLQYSPGSYNEQMFKVYLSIADPFVFKQFPLFVYSLKFIILVIWILNFCSFDDLKGIGFCHS